MSYKKFMYGAVIAGALAFAGAVQASNIVANGSFDTMCYLAEISKKLKYRLNSNFQLNFSSGFNFDVVRI